MADKQKQKRNIKRLVMEITTKRGFEFIIILAIFWLLGSEKATSVFRTVLRIGWWTFVGLFSYNYYLASTSKKPQDETGYVGPVFTLSKKAQEKVQGAYDVNYYSHPSIIL